VRGSIASPSGKWRACYRPCSKSQSRPCTEVVGHGIDPANTGDPRDPLRGVFANQFARALISMIARDNVLQ
jgi:hypothetical protein